MLKEDADVPSFANDGEDGKHPDVMVPQGFDQAPMQAVDVEGDEEFGYPVFGVQVGPKVRKWHERSIQSRRRAICAFGVIFRKPFEKVLDDGRCVIRLKVGNGGRHRGCEGVRLFTAYASKLPGVYIASIICRIHSRADESMAECCSTAGSDGEDD